MVSARTAQFIGESAASALVERTKLNNVWIATKIDDFQRTLMFDMEQSLFFHVSRDRKHYYEEPLKDWGEVPERFPSAIGDIEEASYCFACDRYAATVYHMMLVAELGAIEVGKLIEVKDPKHGWSATVKEVRRVVDRARYDELKPVEREHRELLRELSPFIEGIQSGLRDKWNHMANKLLSGEVGSQRAEEIMLNARAFMTTLANKLPKREEKEQ